MKRLVIAALSILLSLPCFADLGLGGGSSSSSGGQAFPGARVATIGDSIGALSNENFVQVQTTAGGFVVAGTTATLVTTSNHGLGVGDWVHIWNLLGGCTGTIPTNWALAASGVTASTITCTAAQAVIAQANTNQAHWGFGLGLSIPFTANSQTVSITSPNILVAYTGVPAMKGNWYRASVTVTASAAITAGVLKSITGEINVVGGNSAGTMYFFGGDANAFVYSNGYPLASADRLVLTSDPLWLPNDASITAVNEEFLITSGASGTAALQLSSPQFKQIQNPMQ